VRLVVTIDIDNDGVSTSDERNRLTWSSVEVAPAVREQLAHFGLRATWFVRADWQLREVYGDCAHVLREHRGLWRSFVDGGDEVAWHPHLYRRGSAGSFEPERDPAAASAQLRQVHADLSAAGHDFRVTRIGEAFGVNELSATMEDLGLRVDSTAIPGRRRDDASRSFDWSLSPNHPFHPSVEDFRVPGSPARRLWQVPMTTAPIAARGEQRPVPRYLNLAYRPEVFGAALAAWPREDVLVTILHPDELLPHPESHSLYAFDMTALPANLAQLRALGVDSVTMTELADHLDRAGT
jgi:hypothetical protein